MDSKKQQIKEEFLRKVQDEANELEIAIKTLGVSNLSKPAANNGKENLTVKDVISHLIAWKANLIDRGYKKMGKKQKKLFPFSASNLVEKNHQIYEFYKDKGAGEILLLHRDMHTRMMEMLTEVPADMLVDEKGKVMGWALEEALRHPSVHRRRQIEPLRT